ncbi:hypothetical protein ASPWEDRAFT_33984 [Aspergillus wentii DTO 134E9]|uniref:Peptidase S54 rhomboid domain-containing protein n=1 Tax=Aspergillus wentii DTO 134E9 TaxID=1073089 RepID=A0A1L9S046_ASPWE|nr:uncharacterized protein ASPWEDRAFT_33984 [Aspergillus wentii DTO 134E9]KAI9932973.1 hypothetical protein MW887_009226 [Aspergillus wentii]OJJ40559.1 hypothetical protein ASPWEDRAFT_33984 [Aspergillus wentii DTO 134E9]
MHTSGLTNAPISKILLIYTIASSIALSILDIKHLASIHVSPHLWQYGQFWRALIWQGAGFANSTEALFAAMLAYHLRVVERAWGKRKMATFLLSTLPYTTLLPPLLLALVLRPLTLNTLNYLPSGPTATMFALLAQYHASIPHTFRYRIATTTSSSTETKPPTDTSPSSPNGTTASTPSSSSSLTLLLSDKSTTYLIASQLALSQFPTMLLPSLVGWFVGLAWRAELLPGLSPWGWGWRVPAWVVGERETIRRGQNSASGESERYEDLRRRLEGEAAAASSGSMSGVSGSGEQRQRRGGGVMDRLRGVF